MTRSTNRAPTFFHVLWWMEIAVLLVMVVAFRFCCCRSCRSVVDRVQLPRQHAKPTNQYGFLVTQSGSKPDISWLVGRFASYTLYFYEILQFVYLLLKLIIPSKLCLHVNYGA